MALADRLRDVFLRQMDLEENFNVEELQYRDIEQWDSVGHMALITAIEEEFDVALDIDQVIDMSSFKVALEMLRAMGIND